MKTILVVPGHKNWAEKARSSGADLLLWDLEDGVPEHEKEKAEGLVIRDHSAGEMIRVNDYHQGVAIHKKTDALVIIPKCEASPDFPAAVVIETLDGLKHLPAMATSPNVKMILFGWADFALSSGVSASAVDYLKRAATEVSYQAKLNGKKCAWGATVWSRNDLVRRDWDDAISMGFDYFGCISPTQVRMTRGFSDTPAEEVDLEMWFNEKTPDAMFPIVDLVRGVAEA